MFWKLIFISSIFASTLAQFYEDKRCRCVCPTPTSIINSTEKSDRTLYIAYVPPNKCNCDGVILPKVTDEIRDNAQLFCPRCECKYETRNTTVIMHWQTHHLDERHQTSCRDLLDPGGARPQHMEILERDLYPALDVYWLDNINVVVILVLWMLMLLIGYYLFLMLLECLVSKKQQSYVHNNYTHAERCSEETENLLIHGEDTDS